MIVGAYNVALGDAGVSLSVTFIITHVHRVCVCVCV